MSRRTTLALAAIVVAQVSGCELPPAPGSSDVPPWGAALAQVSHGLDLVLQDPQNRSHFRDALRASPFVEHKIVLQDYLMKPDNSDVFNGVAEALDVTPGGLAALLGSIPDMDLYVPSRIHRRQWEPAWPLRVAYSYDPDDSVIMWADSERGRFSARAASDDSENAFVVLHPAESKSHRLTAKPYQPGPVIEDEDDGGIGITLIKRGEDGQVIEAIDLGRDRNEMRVGADDCPPTAPETCSEPGSGVSTRLTIVISHFGDGVGSAEVEWTLSDSNHPFGSTVRVEGLEPYVPKDPTGGTFWGDLGLSHSTPPDNMTVIETDAFSDDYWGTATVQYSDRNTWVESWGPCSSIGDPNTQYDSLCASGPSTITTEFKVNW